MFRCVPSVCRLGLKRLTDLVGALRVEDIIFPARIMAVDKVLQMDLVNRVCEIDKIECGERLRRPNKC